jgi:hypothetical protein
MRKILILALISTSTLLASCAGQYAGLSSEPMASVFLHKNPDYGPMTDAEYQVAVRHANSCKADVDKQLSSVVETMAVGAVAGAVGGGSVGVGAKASGLAAATGAYAIYGAIPGAVGGAINGAATHALGRAADIGACTGADLQDGRTRMPGVHAFPSYVRTKNSSKKIPSWVTIETPADRAARESAAGMQGNDSNSAEQPELAPMPPR